MKIKFKNLIIKTFFLASLACVFSVAAENQILNVFPKSTYTAKNKGQCKISFNYTPSKGPWSEGLIEKDVFRTSIQHKQDKLNSYELRVGVGGQIYSLSGAFGESMPPSWRRNKNNKSPWNDEVWQFVAVCLRYNNWEINKIIKPYCGGYFIHNSGCYIPKKIKGINNIYCPLLNSEHNPKERSYRQLNWGLVPQTQTINRSPLLYYMQVRDAGDGIIELTWVVHNFSVRDDIIFNHLNAPWGGTRVTNLPLQYVSKPDDSLELENMQNCKFRNGQKVRTTGGFNLSSQNPNPNSPALSLVFGLDKHWGKDKDFQYAPSLYRAWRASAPSYKTVWKDWKTRPPNSFRNYDVAVVVPKFNLAPGKTIWYRSYLVVNGKEKAAKQAKILVKHVDYGLLEFSAKNTPLLSVKDNNNKVIFKLFAKPVKGTLPVFKLRHKISEKIAYTTDPYLFTPQKKLFIPIKKSDKNYGYYSKAIAYTLDAQTEYLGMYGYAYKNKPKSQEWKKLSSCVNNKYFPKLTTYHVDAWVKK